MKKSSITLAVALAFTTAFTSPAFAATVVSNVDGNTTSSTFLNARTGGTNGGGAYDAKAAGFTMGSTAYTLSSVDLALRLAGDFGSARPLVQLFGGSASGASGSALATLSGSGFAQGTANYNFTTTSAFTLTAGTTYWLTLSNDSTVANSFEWLATGSAPTGAGATTIGYQFSNGGPPTSGAVTQNFMNRYQINGEPVTVTAAVPEPASWAMMIGGFGMVGGAMRRKRKINTTVSYA